MLQVNSTLRLVLAMAVLGAVLCSPALAGPVGPDFNQAISLTIGPGNWATPGIVVIPIYFSSANGYVDAGLNDFDMEVQLSGADAGLFTPAGTLTAGQTPAVIAGLVGTYFPGANYAFANFSEMTTGGNPPGALPTVAFEAGDNWSNPTSFSEMNAFTIVGLAAFTYSAPLPGNTSVDVSLLGEGAAPTAEFSDNSYSVFDGVATNQGVNFLIPEPATMGLLGLGLVALFARRIVRVKK